MIISVAQFIFKIALSLLLINLFVWFVQAASGFPIHPSTAVKLLEGAWGMGGLALATSIAGLLEAAVMLWLLHERIGGLQLRSMGIFIGRVLLASLVMGFALLVVRYLLDLLLVTTHDQALGLGGTMVALFKLLLELGIGALIYLRCARMLGIEELGPVKRLLDRLKLSWI